MGTQNTRMRRIFTEFAAHTSAFFRPIRDIRVPILFHLHTTMKNFLPVLLLLNAHLLTAQHETGIRLSLLVNKIHDCYSDDSDYRWQPAAPGAGYLMAWQLHPDWYLQTELGYAQRNTHVSSSGVSHKISTDYQMQQIEAGLLGKYQLDIAGPRIRLVFGFSAGYALSGMERVAGHAVGPTSFDNRQRVDFKYFRLKRFQYGPVFGLEVLQPVFRAGALAFDMRCAYYPENDLHSCDHPNEVRFMFGLGYRWLFGKQQAAVPDARHSGKN